MARRASVAYRRGMRRILPLLLALLALGPGAGTALAQTDVDVDIGEPDDRIVVKGDVVLERNERAGTVVVVDGDIAVARGAVIEDDVVSIDGTVRVAGEVRGDVLTIGGTLVVEDRGRVGGDVRWAENEPVVRGAGTIEGTSEQLDPWEVGDLPAVLSSLLWWLAVSLSTLALGLLLLWLGPRAADATFARMREGGWGPAIGVGFVAALGLPVLAVLAIVTLAGAPLGVLLLLALAPLSAAGYVTTCWVLGRAVVGGTASRSVAFLAGWAVLRGVAIIPVLGLLGWICASVFGVGALAVAIWRARSGGTAGPGAPLSPPASAPTSP